MNPSFAGCSRGSCYFSIWALFTPVIPRLGGVPRHARDVASPRAHDLLFCALLAAAHAALHNYLTIHIRPWGEMTNERPLIDMFWGKLTSQLHISVLIYGTVLGVGYAFNYYVKFREREARASQLEAQLAQAQLTPSRCSSTRLPLQHPERHRRPRARQQSQTAVRMIAGLSDLLRHTLDTEAQQEVPLRRELEFLELYLDIQQMRFPDRLRVQMEIAPETLDAEVPNLILQPLVENAISHGIAPRAAPGTVGVSARRDDSLLEIKVYDDGPGLRPNARAGEGSGIGLANTRARLAQLYGAGHRFDVRDRPEGGVEATLVDPFRLSREQQPRFRPQGQGLSAAAREKNLHGWTVCAGCKRTDFRFEISNLLS